MCTIPPTTTPHPHVPWKETLQAIWGAGGGLGLGRGAAGSCVRTQLAKTWAKEGQLVEQPVPQQQARGCSPKGHGTGLLSTGMQPETALGDPGMAIPLRRKGGQGRREGL